MEGERKAKGCSPPPQTSRPNSAHAQLTRDLFAIAKFLLILCHGRYSKMLLLEQSGGKSNLLARGSSDRSEFRPLLATGLNQVIRSTQRLKYKLYCCLYY